MNYGQHQADMLSRHYSQQHQTMARLRKEVRAWREIAAILFVGGTVTWLLGLL